MIDTELYAVLSTAHFKPGTLDSLAATGLIYDDGEARTRIRLPQPDDPVGALPLPEDLAAAIAAVKTHVPSAYGIMFDRDGSMCADLECYPWDAPET